MDWATCSFQTLACFSELLTWLLFQIGKYGEIAATILEMNLLKTRFKRSEHEFVDVLTVSLLYVRDQGSSKFILMQNQKHKNKNVFLTLDPFQYQPSTIGNLALLHYTCITPV